MRKKAVMILPILVCCLLLISLNAENGKPAACPFPLKQIYMCNEKNGWGLSMENEILYTENGIENLIPIKKLENTNKASEGFANAVFMDEQTAYVTYFSSDNEHLVVEYTRDCGVNWQQTLIPYTDYADAGCAFLCFADGTNGYLLYCSTPALGQMTKLLFATDDAGNTFTFAEDLTSIIAGYPQGISAVSNDKISIAVTYHGVDSYLYQSADAAKTWKSAAVFSRTDDVRYVDGYAPIYYGPDRQEGAIILKVMRENAVYELFTTTDAGENWTLNGEIPCDALLDYSVSGDGKLYVIDQSGALYYFPASSKESRYVLSSLISPAENFLP